MVAQVGDLCVAVNTCACTLYIISLFSGNSESCRLLLKAGAKIDSVDKDGLTGNLLSSLTLSIQVASFVIC